MNEERLERYLANVVLDLLAAIQAANLSKPGTEKILLARLDEILDQFGRDIQDVLPEHIVYEYFDGVDQANKALAAAGAAAATPAIQNGVIQPIYRQLIHLEAVEEIIDDAMLDIADAIATTRGAARASVLSVVDQVRGELAGSLIRGDSQDMATKRLMDTFLKEGLTAFVVEDKNGILRRLPLNHYSRTVVRSKTRTAQVNGSINRYKDIGQQFVRIVGNGDSCAQCSQYRNLIVAIGEAAPGVTPYTEGNLPLPPYHPNCRCGVISFTLAEAAPEELEAVAEALAEYKPGVDRRSEAEKAAYKREQDGRRRANEDVKQYQRWQLALGAEAPKNFGAFQRMKRQNTVKFQQLQSEYRSFAMINREK